MIQAALSQMCIRDSPDKVADQISDAVLDKLLAYDPSSKVACETLVTTGQVAVSYTHLDVYKRQAQRA